MASVSPLPFDAMVGLGNALMGVMRGTAVSFLSILTVTKFSNTIVVRASLVIGLKCEMEKWNGK